MTRRISWKYAIVLGTIHLAALSVLSPWLFSWTGVVLLVVGIYVYGGLGINIAYHRLLTHRSFKCPLWLERLLVLVGRLLHGRRAGQLGGDAPLAPLRCRRHSRSAQPAGQLFVEPRRLVAGGEPRRAFLSAYERYARDVLRDPFYMRLQRTQLLMWIYLAHAAIYFLAGFAAGWWSGGSALAGLQFGMSFVAWGVLLRTVCVWHISWSVNSLAHLAGYRNYETGENSRNNWLVALSTSGEGWHNNHHAIHPARRTAIAGGSSIRCMP